jgi:hypothetical protein
VQTEISGHYQSLEEVLPEQLFGDKISKLAIGGPAKLEYFRLRG